MERYQASGSFAKLDERESLDVLLVLAHDLHATCDALLHVSDHPTDLVGPWYRTLVAADQPMSASKNDKHRSGLFVPASVVRELTIHLFNRSTARKNISVGLSLNTLFAPGCPQWTHVKWCP